MLDMTYDFRTRLHWSVLGETLKLRHIANYGGCSTNDLRLRSGWDDHEGESVLMVCHGTDVLCHYDSATGWWLLNEEINRERRHRHVRNH